MALTAAHLRKWADELDAEEKAELEAAERAKLQRLLDQPTLTPEEIEWMRKTKAELDAELEDEDKPKPAREKPKPKAEEDEEKPAAEEDEDEKPAKTRPGRKSGMAYDWDVDDDGKVRKLDIARIYSGPDEDDEVSLEADAA